MNFKELFHRANIDNITEFLLTGSERLVAPNTKSYSERLWEAERKISEFFESRYPDFKELDEVTSYYYQQMGVYQNVFFEAGLLIGSKLGFHMRERMEELE